MGGFGSGDWYRWNKRDTTAETLGLDVRQPARQGALREGYYRVSWPREGERAALASVGVLVPDLAERPEMLLLDYRALIRGEWRDVTDPVDLEWAACNYGGWRPWFLCPGYGHGVGCVNRRP